MRACGVLLLLLLRRAAGRLSDNGPAVCGSAINGGDPPLKSVWLDITCQTATIATIPYLSYGTEPQGSCGSLQVPSCDINSTVRTLIESQCIGKTECRIWPNTTTFGDPCFGTPKVLVVEASCSAGTVSISSNYPGPPVPTPPQPASAQIDPDFSNRTEDLQTHPSLQVVAHALLMRNSPIHDRLFQFLANLSASYVRYVPWLPTPRLSVAELNPPSGDTLCGGEPAPAVPGAYAALDCGEAGGTIAKVTFASFGNPSGHCGSFKVGACDAMGAVDTVEAMCIGKRSCVVPSSADTFPGLSAECLKNAALAIAVQCSNTSYQHTYWNFTLPDAQFLDVWNAIDGHEKPAIPNFSTPPTWLYDADRYGYNLPCTLENGCKYPGYEQGPAPASANGGVDALGAYYGRILSWYNRGGFADEYGNDHHSGHALNISIWEVFNEPDYEHAHTPQSYTAEFDAIVRGIRKWADPDRNIRFVGMSLPNIDLQDTVVSWAEYFLNVTNHDSDARDALDFIGFHSYPAGPAKPPGGFPSDASYAGFFTYIDQFFAKVLAVRDVIQRLSPSTRICLDESGTDNGLRSIDDPVYFVASGAQFAYLFSRAATLGGLVRVVGQSQFMDSPDREAPVTMMDWRNGNPTAKYWVLKLLIDNFQPGRDALVSTGNSNEGGVHAQGFVSSDGAKKVLLINKQYATANVTVTGMESCQVATVDAATNENPPRQETVKPCVLKMSPYAVSVVTAA